MSLADTLFVSSTEKCSQSYYFDYTPFNLLAQSTVREGRGWGWGDCLCSATNPSHQTKKVVFVILYGQRGTVNKVEKKIKKQFSMNEGATGPR